MEPKPALDIVDWEANLRTTLENRSGNLLVTKQLLVALLDRLTQEREEANELRKKMESQTAFLRQAFNAFEVINSHMGEIRRRLLFLQRRVSWKHRRLISSILNIMDEVDAE